MTPKIEYIAGAALAVAAAALVLWVLWGIWSEEYKRKRMKTLTHNGASTQYWYNYSTHAPRSPYGEYLVTDGCQYWTATWEDAVGTFEPLDWTVTHFTPILPPTEETTTEVPKGSKTPHEWTTESP